MPHLFKNNVLLHLGRINNISCCLFWLHLKVLHLAVLRYQIAFLIIEEKKGKEPKNKIKKVKDSSPGL